MFEILCLIHLTYKLSKKQEHRKEKPRELKHVLVILVRNRTLTHADGCKTGGRGDAPAGIEMRIWV